MPILSRYPPNLVGTKPSYSTVREVNYFDSTVWEVNYFDSTVWEVNYFPCREKIFPWASGNWRALCPPPSSCWWEPLHLAGTELQFQLDRFTNKKSRGVSGQIDGQSRVPQKCRLITRWSGARGEGKSLLAKEGVRPRMCRARGGGTGRGTRSSLSASLAARPSHPPAT